MRSDAKLSTSDALTEFLAKVRRLLPDSERRDNIIFSSRGRGKFYLAREMLRQRFRELEKHSDTRLIYRSIRK
jgi:hypothetical protein